MVRDDLVRLILWAGVLVGFVTAAASLGDPRHLKCMTCGGAALMVASLAGILRSVILGKTAPAVAVVDILEAPSVAHQVEENAQQIEELAMRADLRDDRIRALSRLVNLSGAAYGRRGADTDATAPMRCLSVVPEDEAGGHGNGVQAGLCPVGRPAAALIALVR